MKMIIENHWIKSTDMITYITETENLESNMTSMYTV